MNKWLLLGLFVLILIASLITADWSEDLNNGLVSYYDFEDNVEDSVGENDGTNYGAIFVDGKIGKALSFDGIDDYVNIPDDDSLDLNEFTLSVWFKADTQHEGYIINKGYNSDNPAEEDISYRLYVTDPHITGDDWTYENGRVFSRFGWIKNQWNHAVFTYDGNEQVLYLNGGQVDSDIQTGTVLVNDFSLMLGARLYTGLPEDIYYEGLLDEFGIWNRALTQEEVTQLWNNGNDADNDGVLDWDDRCPGTIEEQLIYGCSCKQILELKPGEDTIENRQGCSQGLLNVFENAIGWAKDLF